MLEIDLFGVFPLRADGSEPLLERLSNVLPGRDTMEQGNTMGTEVLLGRRCRSATRFRVILGAIVLGALIFRIAYIVVLRKHAPAPDGYWYFFAASRVRYGLGFVNFFTGRPDASHPPAWPLTLSIPMWFSPRSMLSAQKFAALIGGATVVAVALAGRRISSDRAGLIAATIAAFYPGLWVYEQSLLSETLLVLLARTFQ